MQGMYGGRAAEPKAIPLEENLFIAGIGNVQLKDSNEERNGFKLYKMTYTDKQGITRQCDARLFADNKFRYDDLPHITAQPQPRFERVGSQYLVTLS